MAARCHRPIGLLPLSTPLHCGYDKAAMMKTQIETDDCKPTILFVHVTLLQNGHKSTLTDNKYYYLLVSAQAFNFKGHDIALLVILGHSLYRFNVKPLYVWIYSQG